MKDYEHNDYFMVIGFLAAFLPFSMIYLDFGPVWAGTLYVITSFGIWFGLSWVYGRDKQKKE